MSQGFRGEVVDFYHRYRRGYPDAVVRRLVDAFALGPDDTVADVGCGTGQLTLALSGRVGAVIGLDPEADMLARARAEAGEHGVTNALWLLGGDTDMPALHAAVGDGGLACVTIAQALHWMDHETLFARLPPLLRPGGGVAVVTNGLPLWQQDTPWSRALNGALAEWVGHPLTARCGTDEKSRRAYRTALADAGFTVRTRTVAYTDELSMEQLVGGVYSAMSADLLPAPDRRPALTESLTRAVEAHAPFVEEVRVHLLLATLIHEGHT